MADSETQHGSPVPWPPTSPIKPPNKTFEPFAVLQFGGTAMERSRPRTKEPAAMRFLDMGLFSKPGWFIVRSAILRNSHTQEGREP